MTKQQRLQRVVDSMGKYRGFFKEKYNDVYPSLSDMLNDINKIDDLLIRFGCTMSLFGDSINRDSKLYKDFMILCQGVMENWVEGNWTDQDVEDNRQLFIRDVLKNFIPAYDKLQKEVI